MVLLDNVKLLQALSLAMECYAMKPDLLTNATAVEDAIRFVEANSGNRKRRARIIVVIFKSRFNECLIFFPLNWIAVMVVVAFEDPFLE